MILENTVVFFTRRCLVTPLKTLYPKLWYWQYHNIFGVLETEVWTKVFVSSAGFSPSRAMLVDVRRAQPLSWAPRQPSHDHEYSASHDHDAMPEIDSNASTDTVDVSHVSQSEPEPPRDENDRVAHRAPAPLLAVTPCEPPRRSAAPHGRGAWPPSCCCWIRGTGADKDQGWRWRLRRGGRERVGQGLRRAGRREGRVACAARRGEKGRRLAPRKWVRTSAWEHINHMVLAPRMLFFWDNNDAFF